MSKQEFRGVAGDVGAQRADLIQRFAPQYQANRDVSTNIFKFGNPVREQSRADINDARSMYGGMLDDPSKRGYSESDVAKMYGKQADVARAGGRDLSRSLTKASAAGGMGGTGAMMRNAMVANEDMSGKLISAQRDVDLANAEQKRKDLWAAATGMMDVGTMEQKNAEQIRLENQAYMQQQQDSLDAENRFWGGTIMPTYTQQTEAYEQANQPGFWGNLATQMLSSAAGAATGAGVTRLLK